jgi:O-antigen ligase
VIAAPLLRDAALVRRANARAAAAIVVLAVLAGLVAGVVVARLQSSPAEVRGLALAVPVGVLVAVLAATNFEWFLLVVIATRSALDVFTDPNTVYSVRSGPPGRVDPSTAMLLALLGFGAAWLYVQRRAGTWYRTSWATRSVWLLVAVAALTTVTAEQRATAAVATVKLAGSAMAFSILEQFLARRVDRARRLLVAVVVAAVIPLVLGAYQIVAGVNVPVEPSLKDRIRGPFLHPNTLGSFLAFGLVAAIVLLPGSRGRFRALLAGMTGLAAIELVMTGNRSAWGGVLLAGLVLVPKVSRTALPILVGVVIVTFVAVPSARARITHTQTSHFEGVPSSSFSWRVAYWHRLVPIGEQHPLLGIGLDGASVLDPKLLDRPDVFGGRPPHSLWVESFVEMGLLGTAAMIGVVAGFAVTLRRRLRAATEPFERQLALIAIGAAVVILTQSPVENVLIQPVLWWYLAAVMTFGLTPVTKARRTGPAKEPTPSPVATSGAR